MAAAWNVKPRKAARRLGGRAMGQPVDTGRQSGASFPIGAMHRVCRDQYART
jgi:hypothetical protein